MFRAAGILCAIAALLTGAAHATTAVIEVNAEPWYTGKLADLNGCSVTRGYAPFPVLFEGWKSEPWSPGTEYRWEFGDGGFGDGFNAAHVYSDPGTHTATLTVTDATGVAATATLTVEVLAPDGRTFYVDAAMGDDANDGLDPARAWRTATHALRGIAGRYGPGDRVLFRRGQTFDLDAGVVKPGHWSYKWGYSFGAYGEGEKPVIKKTPLGKTELLRFYGVGAMHIGFQDLVFDGTSSDGLRSTIFTVLGQAQSLLFLRCGFLGGYQHVGANAPAVRDKCVSGFFVVDCMGGGSSNASIYVKAVRAALVGNTWDGAGNHICYGSWLPYSAISNNLFARPAHGRAALRISSSSQSLTAPTEYVDVRFNVFRGWQDPAYGNRWNGCLATISPNVPGDELMRHIRWENNVATGAETCLQLGACEDVVVRGNRFEGENANCAAVRIRIGSEFDSPPINGILFADNTIVADESRAVSPYWPAVIGVLAGRRGPARGIRLLGNTVVTRGGERPLMVWLDGNEATRGEIVASANAWTVARDAPAVMAGGWYKEAGRVLSLDQWHAETGNEPPRAAPVPPEPPPDVRPALESIAATAAEALQKLD